MNYSATPPLDEVDIPVVFPNYAMLLERDGRFLAFNPNTFVLSEVNAAGKRLLIALKEITSIRCFMSTLRQLLTSWPDGYFRKTQELIVHWARIGLLEGEDAANAQLTWRYQPLQAPLQELYVSPTNACNLHCKYCYNSDFRKTKKPDLTVLSKEDWFSVFEDFKILGGKDVVFTGGEPLLYHDIKALINKCSELELEVRLLTNGTLIDNNWAAWIAENVDVVNISLDSADAEKNDSNRGNGTFHNITKGVKKLAKLKPDRVFIRSVITNNSVENHKDLVDFVHDELGCQVGTPTLYIPSSLDDLNNGLMPEFDQYLQVINDFTERSEKIYGINPWEESQIEYASRCGVGSSTISVDAKGDVYPCQALHKASMIAGNVREDGGLMKIYKTSEILEKLRNFPLDRIDKCNNCNLVTACGAGCRAIAHDLYGSIEAYNDLFCPLYREGTIEKLWRWIDKGKVNNNILPE